jgi:glycosyltransferase involved in cell wall biosynthesis
VQKNVKVAVERSVSSTKLIAPVPYLWSDSLRVLHLLDTDGFAGTEIHLMALVKALRQSGVEADIACQDDSRLHRAAQEAALPVMPLLTGGRLGQLAAVRKVARKSYDIVHAHNGRTMILAAAAANSRLAAVATQHFIDPQSATYRGLKKGLANQAHRQINRRFTHFIAISHGARDAMIEREGVDPSHITVVPNGTEPVQRLDGAERDELRREMGIESGSLLIVCVARLTEEKGLRYLIEALPTVLLTHPATQVVIAGEGSLRDDLERQVSNLGLQSNLRFLGFRSDATRIMGAADLFVLPSPAEPFGLVLIEAMAQGVPVVATRCGGPLEIIEDGVSGQLVNPADAPDLALAVGVLLLDAKRRQCLGENAMQRFEQHFTAQRMADATLEVYRRAAKS